MSLPAPVPSLHWHDALPFLQPLINGLECGFMLIDEHDRIVVASHPMAAIFGLSVEAMAEMTPAAFVEYVLKLVDDPPDLLRQRRILPKSSAIACEEFELVRPCRSVVRWVARRITQPIAAQIVVCTDITAEVDLAAAYERLAVTDRLTGLANRRGAEQSIRREILRSKRYAVPLSFALFDIDHFKRINDNHGHATGDQVLRQVARTIAGGLRESDLAARWGGEEFLVVLPNTGMENAYLSSERIRRSVAKMSVQMGETVTISGGVVQYTPGEKLNDILGRAHGLLYMAKSEGRNRVR